MFIYFIYIPSPIIEVKVLCTSPHDTAKGLIVNNPFNIVLFYNSNSPNIGLISTGRAIGEELHFTKYKLVTRLVTKIANKVISLINIIILL